VNSPAYDLANILASSAVGLGSLGVDLFVGREPATPNNCSTAFDTGGFDPDTGADYQRPTVQFLVRNIAYNEGWAQANAIRNALHGLYGVVEDGARYIGVWAMGEASHIGYDDNNRALFSVNVRIHRTPTT